MTAVVKKSFQRGSNCLMRIKKLMSGNQNFDQSFYAPLTRIALVCPRETLLLSSGLQWPFTLDVRGIEQHWAPYISLAT
jgi:hypothetical protein